MNKKAPVLKSGSSGFTLLELIIVIIIIGVLASLALPRLFSVIEYSRSAEALAAFSTIRTSMERCYLMNNGTFGKCTDLSNKFSNLDIDDPSAAPNAHFVYTLFPDNNEQYYIVATRTTLDGGDSRDTIHYIYAPWSCLNKDITIWVDTINTSGVFVPLDNRDEC